MSAKGVLGLIAGVLLLAGVVLGFTPMKAHGVSCGSPLHESGDAFVADLTRTMISMNDGLSGLSPHEDACDDRRSIFRPIVWSLLAAGGGLLVVALFVPGKTVPARTVEPVA